MSMKFANYSNHISGHILLSLKIQRAKFIPGELKRQVVSYFY